MTACIVFLLGYGHAHPLTDRARIPFADWEIAKCKYTLQPILRVYDGLLTLRLSLKARLASPSSLPADLVMVAFFAFIFSWNAGALAGEGNAGA